MKNPLDEACDPCNIVGMTLKDYIAMPGHTATGIANAVGVSVSTITRASDGETIPSRELMVKITEHTKGAVKPNDFFGIAA